MKKRKLLDKKWSSDDFENREIIQTKTTVGVKTEHALYDHGIEIETGTDQIDFLEMSH